MKVIAIHHTSVEFPESVERSSTVVEVAPGETVEALALRTMATQRNTKGEPRPCYEDHIEIRCVRPAPSEARPS